MFDTADDIAAAKLLDSLNYRRAVCFSLEKQTVRRAVIHVANL